MNRLILLGVLAVVFVVPAVAQADPGNGAQHISYSVCEDVGFGRICSEGETLIHSRENKNNVSVFSHERVRNTFTGLNGCSLTTQGQLNLHYHFKSDAPDFQGYHFKGQQVTLEVGCGVPSQSCTSTNKYHYANGQVRHESTEFVCTPV